MKPETQTPPLIEQFRKNLRHRRQDLDLTQENMADMLKMTINGYRNIENGHAEPNISKLEKISKALDTEPNTLLGMDNNNYFHDGTHYVGGSNNGPVTFQFDKVVMEGLLSKMSGYEKEIAELKAKLEKLR